MAATLSQRPNASELAKGAVVLVCGDVFDFFGPWQQSQGLGPCVDVSPPPETCFFAGKIVTKSTNGRFTVKFFHDDSVCKVQIDDIHRLVNPDEDDLSPFWVYAPGSAGPKDLLQIRCFV